MRPALTWLDFSKTNIRYGRSLMSYAKVQRAISALIRNRTAFIGPFHSGGYVDIGCGPNIKPEFYAIDYDWHPGIDACWDVTKMLPFPDCTVGGIFTEHCIEHLPLAAFRKLAAEMYRVLQPGARLRIVVPDGEAYLCAYCNGRTMPYAETDIKACDLYTPMMSVNRIFRDHGHQFIYDFATLKALLEQIGFRGLEQMTFGKSANPALAIDTPSRAEESLYVEAVK